MARKSACLPCRSKKLRCSGASPVCDNCDRLLIHCHYASARKTGPKKGYLRSLEGRLMQLEKKIEEHERSVPNNSKAHHTPSSEISSQQERDCAESGRIALESENTPGYSRLEEVDSLKPTQNQHGNEPLAYLNEHCFQEQTLPNVCVQQLHRIYFEDVHPTIPIVHPARYLSSVSDVPAASQPPLCLRHIIWSLAAGTSGTYAQKQEELYQKAKLHVYLDEANGRGEKAVAVAQCQAWVLISHYEIKNALFERAWLSVGNAARLAQMLQLHRLDQAPSQPETRATVQPHTDWTELEERRRLFWAVFCLDRYAGISTGWPMIFREEEVTTHLPSSEESFQSSMPYSACSIQEILSFQNIETLSTLGAVIVVLLLFGRTLDHLQLASQTKNRPESYWDRHQAIDNLLLRLSLHLPGRLRVASCGDEPNAVFAHMMLHALTICLHQAVSPSCTSERRVVESDSEVRCLTSALMISRTLRLLGSSNLAKLHHFTPFCLFVAARVLMKRASLGPLEYWQHQQYLKEALVDIEKTNLFSGVYVMEYRKLELALSGIYLSTEAYMKSVAGWNKSGIGSMQFVQSFTPIYEIKTNTSMPNLWYDEGINAEHGGQSHPTNVVHYHAAWPVYTKYSRVAENGNSQPKPSRSIEVVQGNDSGKAATISELLDLALNATEVSP